MGRGETAGSEIGELGGGPCSGGRDGGEEDEGPNDEGGGGSGDDEERKAGRWVGRKKMGFGSLGCFSALTAKLV